MQWSTAQQLVNGNGIPYQTPRLHLHCIKFVFYSSNLPSSSITTLFAKKERCRARRNPPIIAHTHAQQLLPANDHSWHNALSNHLAMAARTSTKANGIHPSSRSRAAALSRRRRRARSRRRRRARRARRRRGSHRSCGGRRRSRGPTPGCIRSTRTRRRRWGGACP